MLLPAAQYGDWAIVKKRMRSIVTRLARGESVVTVMSEGGMVDTATTPGMLMMGGTMHRGWTNFHCFVPWQSLWQVLIDSPVSPGAPGTMDAIFRESLTVPWGVLGLLSYESQAWFIDETRFQPFLDAVLAVWGELDGNGPRYFTGVQGTTLWSVPNNLHYVLANMGVSSDIIRAPLPPEGPRALLKHARINN
jgi:hypothetical protein